MKFKNSYILLISLISVFLLLSVASVSAADADTIAVDDDAAIDDVSDIDLNDNYLKGSNVLSDDSNSSEDSNEAEVATNATETNDTDNTTTVEPSMTIDEKTNVDVHTKLVNISVTIKNASNNTVSFVKNNISVIYSYVEDNETISTELTDFNVSSRRVIFEAPNLNNASVTIIYKNGTDDQLNASTQLNPVVTVDIIPINTVVDYQSGNFTFKVIDNYTGEIVANRSITIRGFYFYDYPGTMTPYKSFTSDENGIITLVNVDISKDLDITALINNYSSLSVGEYNITFSSDDNGTVVSSDNNKATLTVNKVNATIKASNYKELVNSGKKFTFKVVNSKTGEAIKLSKVYFKIKLNSTGNYTTFNATTNLSGEAGFNLSLYGGTYPIIIQNINDNINAASVKVNATLTKRTGVLTASNRSILFNSAITGIIKVTDKLTKKVAPNVILKVRLYTSSKKYTDYAFMSSSKGYVKFSAPLSVGKHKMIISFLDNNYTGSSITRYVTVKKTTGKITAPKVNTYYKSGRAFKIKLVNAKNGNAMYGTKVTIRVYVSSNKFYKYTGVTNSSGYVSLGIGTLKPGTYKVTVAAGESGYTAKTKTSQIKITKVPTKLTPTKFSAKYGAGKYFKVKVTHKSNKKVLSGVKLKVKVYTSAKKYKTYTIKSNSKGIANLKVTQKVGTYKVVVSSANKYYTASSAKSTITVTK